MARAGWLVAVASVWACGGGSDPRGATDGSTGSEADGSTGDDGEDASTGEDPPGEPDASPGGADAAGDGGMISNPCPLPGRTGLTPGWLEWNAWVDPGQPGLAGVFGIDAAADCSFAVIGATLGAAVLGPGEPNQTALDPSVWFVARFAADGTLEWATELGPRQTDDLTQAAIHVMPDGALAVVRALRGTEEPESLLARVSADGVAMGDAAVVPGRVLLPLADGGAYVARTTSVLERRDAGGEVVWSRAIGPLPVSIAQLADGRVLHASEFLGDTVILNAGQPDAVELTYPRFGCYFALHDPDGSLQWARLVVAAGAAVPFCGVAAAGGWLAAWLRYPADDVTDYRLLDEDGTYVQTDLTQGLVVRYEETGQPAWYRGIRRSFEGDQFSIGPASFSVDAAGGTITLGGSMDGTVSFDNETYPGPGGTTSVSSEPDQAWFARYSAGGALLGPVELSSDAPGTSEVIATATRVDGSAILGGSFTETFALGPFLAQGAGYSAFLAEIH